VLNGIAPVLCRNPAYRIAPGGGPPKARPGQPAGKGCTYAIFVKSHTFLLVFPPGFRVATSVA